MVEAGEIEFANSMAAVPGRLGKGNGLAAEFALLTFAISDQYRPHAIADVMDRAVAPGRVFVELEIFVARRQPHRLKIVNTARSARTLNHVAWQAPFGPVSDRQHGDSCPPDECPAM